MVPFDVLERMDQEDGSTDPSLTTKHILEEALRQSELFEKSSSGLKAFAKELKGE